MSILRGRGGKLGIAAPQTGTAIQTPVGTSLTSISVGQITEWRINTSMGSEEVTEFGDAWVERITTIKDWSGSASGFLDPTQDGATNQDEILGQLVLGLTPGTVTNTGDTDEQMTCIFYTDLTNEHAFVGNVIPSFEIDGSVGGLFAVNLTFEGSGGLIYVTDIT